MISGPGSVAVVLGVFFYTNVSVGIEHLMGGGRVGALTAIPDTPLATDQEERCALPPRPGVQPLRESVATGVPQKTGRAVRMLTQIFIILT